MDEWGEYPTIYVWPKDHVDGLPYPEDFYERLRRGLESVGIEYDTT